LGGDDYGQDVQFGLQRPQLWVQAASIIPIQTKASGTKLSNLHLKTLEAHQTPGIKQGTTDAQGLDDGVHEIRHLTKCGSAIDREGRDAGRGMGHCHSIA